MISVSDILKILEQIPIWKTVSALPKRVAALEDQVVALKAKLDEANAAPAILPGEPCQACGQRAMRRTSRRKSAGVFGDVGAMDETWTCSACGEVEEREVVR
ncbi:hypothetical protein AB6806_27525 [Bosea sp. RCC_152_1]|uniref:hypothetical protein n=1 Tax=Bosea sp. RCC_152_1 TaxID=3239228 RepID=UPI0035257AEA